MPDGITEQVDTLVRDCPVLLTVSVDGGPLVKLPTTLPVTTAELAAHPVTEIRHLIDVIVPWVTPLTVAAVAAMFALPSHTTVNGIPATLHVLKLSVESLDTDCGAAVVGDPEVALLDSVPTELELVHWSVTLVLPVVTVRNVGDVVAVAVALPPGLTVTLALAACAAKDSRSALRTPSSANLRQAIRMLNLSV